jgi:hypothetical protein
MDRLLGGLMGTPANRAKRIGRLPAMTAIAVVVGLGMATAHAEPSDVPDRGDAVDHQNDAILAMPEHGKPDRSRRPTQAAPCTPPADCKAQPGAVPKNVP